MTLTIPKSVQREGQSGASRISTGPVSKGIGSFYVLSGWGWRRWNVLELPYHQWVMAGTSDNACEVKKAAGKARRAPGRVVVVK